ncbi:hypothetical protein TPA0909_61500 [Streptomyces albus]|nr:hypothetical protein TPA0909_61500 [Streptomyces albus]
MSVLTTRTSGSRTQAHDLRRLLDSLVADVPGVRSVAVVSSDGLLLLASDPALGTEHGTALGRHAEDAAVPPCAQQEASGSVASARAEQATTSGAAVASGAVMASGSAAAPGSAAMQGTAVAPGAPPPLRRRRDAGRRGRSGPVGASGDLATIVSGVASLTSAAADLLDGGGVKQTMVAMDEGALLVMTIGDGSLLGVHAAADCDLGTVGYQMALFVGRAGHMLTPELRSELRQSAATLR